MSESLEKRLRKASTAELTSLIVRLNDYLERMNSEKAKKLVDSASKVAESVARLTELIPRDMAFSIVRHVENLSQKTSNFRFVYDTLLEEFAACPEISSVVGD